MSMKRVWSLAVGLLLGGLGGVPAAHAAPPCISGDAPALELRVTAAALAPDSDRSLTVRVFDGGCVQVHRPAYRRDAGDFRLDLQPAALEALRLEVDQPALRAFDAKRVQKELAAAQRKRNAGEGRELRYGELDADTYEIHWRSGSKRSAAVWNGLPDRTGAAADQASLQAFRSAATALQALAERGDAVRIDGGRP